MTVLADLSKLTDLTPNEKELVSYIKRILKKFYPCRQKSWQKPLLCQ